MGKLSKMAEGEQLPVHFVSISVDPGTDTPETLKAYAVRHHANFQNWTFLTGPEEVVRKVVVSGFLNAMGEKKDGEVPSPMEITHGQNFALVDKKGQVRGFRSNPTDDDLQKILKDLSQLVKE
jgi:protein SCO1/2